MKITIEPESKNEPAQVVIENVYQYSLCGSLVKGKITNETFRRNIVHDPNELIGLLESAQEDIKDYKRGIRNGK